MGGPDATPNLWKQLFSAVRASGGYPGNDKRQTGAVHWPLVVYFTKEIAKLNQTATQCRHIVHKDILQWAITVSTNSYIKSSSAKVNKEKTCVS